MPKLSGWKVYRIVNDSGKKSCMIIHTDETDFPQDFLEYDEKIEYEQWLSDVLKCNDENIAVINNM